MKKTIRIFSIIALIALIGFTFAACSDDPPPLTPTPTLDTNLSLDGVWESDHGIVISIYGGKGVFTNIDAFAGWREVEKAGNIQIGASYFKNISKTGDLTWSYQVQTYKESTYDLSDWQSGTLTLNSNGQTFNSNTQNTQNPNHTWTRQR